MHTIASFITNPFEIFNMPFVMFEKASMFAVTIMQQSIEFATSIMRLAV